jgi:signal transduction histidine kinase/ActR/RegA family two-component response regulator
MQTGSSRQLVGLVALIVPLVIAVAGPLGYLAQQTQTQAETLGFKARFTADRVARYIYLHSELWQYHGTRIADAIALSPLDMVHQTVTDTTGAIVLEQGPVPLDPTTTFSAPVIVADKEVGRVILATSLRPIMVKTGIFTAIAWLLAAGAFLGVRCLPLRALDRAMAELARQKARFGLALDNMGQGLCMLDAERKVVVVSQRLVEMFALADSERLAGMEADRFAALLRARIRPSGATPDSLLNVLPGTAPGSPANLVLDDGRVIAVARHTAGGGLIVITFDDITTQVHARSAEADRAAALAEARVLRERERVAQETSKAKSMFLATMSHEIRTPMNAVLGLATTLLESDLTEEQRGAVRTIHESGDSLLRILNDILDYSKLEAGRLVFEHVTFSPATLAEAARSILGPRAAAKRIDLVIDTALDLPAGVKGDVGRLRQVLLNLVSNAVKFTAAGTVTIETRCAVRSAGMATLSWRVRDTGIGIAPEQLSALFVEFVQADGSINRRFGGSGLGLAISKRIIEQMGGTIAVDSTLGTGSSFSFEVTLPLAEPVRPSGARSEGDEAADLRSFIASKGRPLRVLVAEDNATNQFVIRQMLKGFDILLDMAADGAEAVTAAEQGRHDAIFMDMQMPEVDGLAATRQIRARGGRLAVVPIIALTGNAFDEDERACAEAGMDAFIAKPINKNLLLRTLLRLCGAMDPAAPALAETTSGD